MLFLVDYENVYKNGFAGLETLKPDDEVVVFSSKNASLTAQEVGQYRADVAPTLFNQFIVTAITGRKKCVDFKICQYAIMRLLTGTKQITIISSDSDFMNISEFIVDLQLKLNNVVIARGANIGFVDDIDYFNDGVVDSYRVRLIKPAASLHLALNSSNIERITEDPMSVVAEHVSSKKYAQIKDNLFSSWVNSMPEDAAFQRIPKTKDDYTTAVVPLLTGIVRSLDFTADATRQMLINLCSDLLSEKFWKLENSEWVTLGKSCSNLEISEILGERTTELTDITLKNRSFVFENALKNVAQNPENYVLFPNGCVAKPESLSKLAPFIHEYDSPATEDIDIERPDLEYEDIPQQGEDDDEEILCSFEEADMPYEDFEYPFEELEYPVDEIEDLTDEFNYPSDLSAFEDEEIIETLDSEISELLGTADTEDEDPEDVITDTATSVDDVLSELLATEYEDEDPEEDIEDIDETVQDLIDALAGIDADELIDELEFGYEDDEDDYSEDEDMEDDSDDDFSGIEEDFSDAEDNFSDAEDDFLDAEDDFLDAEDEEEDSAFGNEEDTSDEEILDEEPETPDVPDESDEDDPEDLIEDEDIAETGIADVEEDTEEDTEPETLEQIFTPPLQLDLVSFDTPNRVHDIRLEDLKKFEYLRKCLSLEGVLCDIPKLFVNSEYLSFRQKYLNLCAEYMRTTDNTDIQLKQMFVSEIRVLLWWYKSQAGTIQVLTEGMDAEIYKSIDKDEPVKWAYDWGTVTETVLHYISTLTSLENQDFVSKYRTEIGYLYLCIVLRGVLYI